MELQQLELELWRSLAAASQFPETANLRSLCDALEQAISDQPLGEQLHLAGDVLMQLTEVYAARAEWMISRWEHQHTPSEPVVDLEECVDLFVQSLSLDVAELFDEPEPVQYPANRSKKSSIQAEGSVAGEVNKDTLLNWVDQMATEQTLDETRMLEQIRDLAHGENVEEWSKAIVQALQSLKSTVRLVELQQTLQMPMMEVWLGLLLGGYVLEQSGEFYDIQSIWIIGSVDLGTPVADESLLIS